MMGFKLVRFNPRRAFRKGGAAEVEVDDGDNVVRLWMTQRDIEKNIIEYSDQPPEQTQGLRDALAAYKRPWQEIGS